MNKNALEAIPSSFLHLSALEELSLCHNQILSLSHGPLVGIPNLRHLLMYHNHISKASLSIFEPLVHLETLQLHSNSLLFFPINILVTHVKLKTLLLHSNKIIELLSNSINNNQITSAGREVTLTLNHNVIEELPSSIASLFCHEISHLNLFNNKLQNVENLYFVEYTRITVVDLHGNELRSLPVALFQMKALEELYLQHNQLMSLPDLNGNLAPHLRVLVLHHNRLQTLPVEMGNFAALTMLNVSKNFLVTVPSSLTLCENLQELKIDGNPLEPALVQVLKDGWYESALQKRYKMAVRKLIDGVQLRAKRFVESEAGKKELQDAQISLRKGRARNVVQYLDITWKRMFDGQGSMSCEVFQKNLLVLGIAWSPFEIKALVQRHSTISDKTSFVKVGHFLNGLEETALSCKKAPPMTITQAILLFLSYTAHKPTPPPSQLPHRPTTASSQTASVGRLHGTSATPSSNPTVARPQSASTCRPSRIRPVFSATRPISPQRVSPTTLESEDDEPVTFRRASPQNNAATPLKPKRLRKTYSRETWKKRNDVLSRQSIGNESSSVSPLKSCTAMVISIHPLDHTPSFTLQLESLTTIGDLKGAIELHRQIPIAQQVL